MTTDNWGLKKLFHFDDTHWNISNDTNEIVNFRIKDGRELPIKPGQTLNLKPDDYSIILPNSQVIRYSDKAGLKDDDFGENFNVIIGHLMRRLKDGHVIDGLDFLDYHYKWTKNKSRFLTFIKHYILTVLWLPVDQKDKQGMFIDAIRDWVNEKKKLKRRPLNIVILLFPLIVYVVCWVLSPNYKEVFIGALIGGLAAPLKELYDLFTDKD